MAFFGAIPQFVPALVPGESLLAPVPAELQNPTESSTIVAQNFNVVSLFATARIGAIFPIMELRDLFPAVAHIAAGGGNPEVLAQAAEVGPVPVCYANYRLPAGAYQLLSANSLIVTLGCVLNLYGAEGIYPARCSLLPIGTDALPVLITLPAAHASSLLMMSEEGIRWMRLTATYDPLFVAVQDNNLPVYTLPSVLTAPIPGGASAAAPATGVVKEGEQNPAFPVGAPNYTTAQERHSNIWGNQRPIYVFNNCDRGMPFKLCGNLDPFNKIAKENLRRRVGWDFRTCVIYQDNMFKQHITQNFAEVIEESSPGSMKFNCNHLRMYLTRGSLTDPLPRINSIDHLKEGINNWATITCQTLTPNSAADIQFFSRLTLSFTTTLSDKIVGGIGKINSIDALVDFVSKLFVKLAELIRRVEYNNPVVTRELQMIFPREISTIFNFDQVRNFADATFIDRTKTQILLQFPINKSLDKLEEEKIAGKKRSYEEKGSVPSTDVIPNGLPNPNDNGLGGSIPVVDNPRSNTKHCINNFADQLKVSNGFANGMPEDAKVRACNPASGVCTFVHTVVDHTPGSLDKGIADELIKATANFGNASFKSNFVRIVKFLKEA